MVRCGLLVEVACGRKQVTHLSGEKFLNPTCTCLAYRVHPSPLFDTLRTTPTSPSSSPFRPPTSSSSSSSPSSPPPPTSMPITPSSSSPPTSPTSTKKVKCKNKNYPQCYNIEHVCPIVLVDAWLIVPLASLSAPGAVCQDPRFIGGDGITFYFHGKKDRDFCLVSDPNLHINAHFIGRRNQNMKRDFTWVQSIAVFFDKHQLFVGAQKTATWEDSADHLALSFNGEPIFLQEAESIRWQSASAPTVSITRVSDTNSMIVEGEGSFRITAKVVPITEEDSRVHNYGITKEDCFAHLDLGFKFFSLSNKVNGILGQTYRRDYMIQVKMGVSMPVIGRERDFETSSLLAADCPVAQFKKISYSDDEASLEGLELPNLRCGSRGDGRGVVCKR
ncbi:hypothetical protein CK203_032095 [Vitis vinifera]|uniref:Root cap n=1 Tax=Vitis vinifera TaxID=29760 RepID=A0A438FNG8_VITVI|nr:hypothetical protein CK203_032095 [Vitis vinifera]